MAQNVDSVLKPGVNLENCDQEAIHIPGSIQPHGVLIALDDALVVRVVSDNSASILGRDHERLIGTSADLVFDQTSHAQLQHCLRDPEGIAANNPYTLAVHDLRSSKLRWYDAIIHLSGGLLMVELEREVDAHAMPFKGFFHATRQAVRRLQLASDLKELCAIAADEVRVLTGFDRVMVYQFDTDWHGEVVAESKAQGLESFLGLHYPASDIPAQARRLYISNWIRLIKDVSYRPARLFPADNPLTGQALDLSFSVLRSVSPIHIEYLRNMGVSASMSISLIHRNKDLWGLIACHHYSPRFVSYEVRLASEFLGQILSWRVAAHEQLMSARLRARVEQVKAELLKEAVNASEFVDGLLRKPELFLQLVNADGAAIFFEGRCRTVGHTPPLEALEVLARRAEPKNGSFATSCLPKVWPEAQAYAATASGMLAVQLGDVDSNDCILWFRQEVTKTVDWAGARPDETAPRHAEVRLSPRGSFALWRETVRFQCLKWQEWEVAAAESLVHAINKSILTKAAEIKELYEELNESSRAKDEFLGVISHELRTPLNAMMGWIELLQAGDVSEDEYDEALATIARNAQAQHKLIEDLLDVSRIISGKIQLHPEEVETAAFVTNAVESLRPTARFKKIDLRFELGERLGNLRIDLARLHQVMWNLLSNAIKFTPEGGSIVVRCQREEAAVVLSVTDSGDGIGADFLPYVFERFRQGESHAGRKYQGLGLGLAIVRYLVELHGGSVTASSEGKGKGAQFTVRIPVVRLPESNPIGQRVRRQRGVVLEKPAELVGLKILVVDDDVDARRMLEKVLRRCEMQLVLAASGEEGLALFASERPDLVLSDLGMPGMDGYEMVRGVRRLSAQGGGRVIAVALTAFASSSDRTQALQAGYNAHIAKPVSPSELLALLASLVRSMPLGP